MIDRGILQHKDLRKFDFFNDAKDTVNWLRSLKTNEANALAKRIEAGYEAYRKRNSIFPRWS